ncbi:GAF domain-containing protein [Nocardia sp. NPDC004068]|uniref:GAF domain-containing protein n=1 Tax=Nocardia sp. NPDC004068 TaxID=3364303 RepID=UPI0036A9A7F2
MQDRHVPSRSELLIETLGREPRVIAENGRVRDFRKISSVLRPVDARTVTRLVGEVVKSAEPVVRTADVPDAPGGTTERHYAGYPVSGPDNIVSGVQVVYGNGIGTPSAHAAAFQ